MRPNFIAHLDRLNRWLAEQPHIAVLQINYKSLVERPAEMAAIVNDFLGGRGVESGCAGGLRGLDACQRDARPRTC